MNERTASGRREAAAALVAYAAYLGVRHVVWTDRGRRAARTNAQRVVDAERALRIDVEPDLQRLVARWPRIIDALNVGYAAGNVALSVGWLLLLHHLGDKDFRRERTAAMVAFAGALPWFAAVPTAPPRTLDGFVDTLAERGWNLDHPLLMRFYNPIAAMPSHHVAFASVTGFGLARRRRSPLARTACRSYPAVVAAVVIATGNHFTLDVVAGAALGAVARRIARATSGGAR